jgi:hypothetical protein
MSVELDKKDGEGDNDDEARWTMTSEVGNPISDHWHGGGL